MNHKLEALDTSIPTIAECYNIVDNINDMLYQLVEEDTYSDEDDQLKTMIHFLSLVMDKLQTLKHLDESI